MTDKPSFAAPATSEINELRARLRAMSLAELRRFGTSARLKCSQSKPGDPQCREFAIQLEEAMAEWLRRHPKKTKHSVTDKKEHADA